MNLGELKTECGKLLSDPNHDRWSEDNLTTRLNQAQVEIVTATNCLKARSPFTPVANTAEITLEEETVDILRAYIANSDGEYSEVLGKTQEELNYLYPNWRQWSPGKPKYFWLNATGQQLSLVPAPSSEYANTDGFEIWRVKVPGTNMSVSTDIPFDQVLLMVPYHMALVHWTVSQCWMDDGTPEALGKSKFHRSGDMERPGQYELIIKKIIAKFDNPTEMNHRILWRPEGGRVRTCKPSKEYPLG